VDGRLLAGLPLRLLELDFGTLWDSEAVVGLANSFCSGIGAIGAVDGARRGFVTLLTVPAVSVPDVGGEEVAEVVVVGGAEEFGCVS
jgi:hypothetical protein